MYLLSKDLLVLFQFDRDISLGHHVLAFVQHIRGCLVACAKLCLCRSYSQNLFNGFMV